MVTYRFLRCLAISSLEYVWKARDLISFVHKLLFRSSMVIPLDWTKYSLAFFFVFIQAVDQSLLDFEFELGWELDVESQVERPLGQLALVQDQVREVLLELLCLGDWHALVLDELAGLGRDLLVSCNSKFSAVEGDD